MTHRPLRSRTAVAAVAAALVLGLGTAAPALALPGEDPSGADAFRPQLVTIDTPTRADKQLLQTLGLDLTEHAGHDYVEVVLHSSADVAALEGAGLTYAVRIADLLLREAQNNQVTPPTRPPSRVLRSRRAATPTARWPTTTPT